MTLENRISYFSLANTWTKQEGPNRSCQKKILNESKSETTLLCQSLRSESNKRVLLSSNRVHSISQDQMNTRSFVKTNILFFLYIY